MTSFATGTMPTQANVLFDVSLVQKCLQSKRVRTYTVKAMNASVKVMPHRYPVDQSSGLSGSPLGSNLTMFGFPFSCSCGVESVSSNGCRSACSSVINMVFLDFVESWTGIRKPSRIYPRDRVFSSGCSTCYIPMCESRQYSERY